MNIQDLHKEFPKSSIHWRAQTVTRNGDKALALAYIDARDVMNRLDSVCGAENWQDTYVESQKGRVICSLSIKIGDEWITKSDGAGDTAVEGEKGGISDAFKRAAVKWGIGRYLYALDAVWCPCETYEKNGKRHWSKWTESPWNYVKGGKPKEQPKKAEPPKQIEEPKKKERADPNLVKSKKFVGDLTLQLTQCKDYKSLSETWDSKIEQIDWIKKHYPKLNDGLIDTYKLLAERLTNDN